MCALNQHIVEVNFHCFSNLLEKHRADEALICGSSIPEPKWHYLVTIKASVSDKRGMFLIWPVHENFVVSEVGVHEAEQLISGNGVNHLVYHGKGKAVFWAGFVEVDEIYAYPLVLFIFLHKNWVCNPLDILGLTYEPITH